jgi:23S rRNA (guanosine2251-2'-O)-methyltransferase
MNKGKPPHRAFDRTAPAAAGRLLLYGRHAVLAAIRNADRPCHRLVGTPEAIEALRAEAGDALAERRGLGIEHADKRGLARLVRDEAVHQDLVLEAGPLPDLDEEDLIRAIAPDAPALVLVLDRITDPRNVGAILRSAAAFGAAGVVLTERHAPGETGALAKAAAGAMDLLPVARVVNLARALQRLKEAEFWVYGLDGDAPEGIERVADAPRAALVLGSEGEGLRRLTRETCDKLVRIDLPGRRDPARRIVDSLNVSNAAAVALYAMTVGRRR